MKTKFNHLGVVLLTVLLIFGMAGCSSPTGGGGGDDAPPPGNPITKTSDGGGSSTASPSRASAGVTIEIRATPSDGFRFVQWEVEEGVVTLGSTTANPTTFTMPGTAVKIKAVFEELDEDTPNLYFVPAVPAQGENFGSLPFGYTQAPAARTFNLRNNGTGDATVASWSSSGNIGYFTVEGNSGTQEIAMGANHAVTVRPNTGLAVGTHTGTITASYGSGRTATLTVSFTVDRAAGAAVSGAPTVSGSPTHNSITINAVTNPSGNGQSVQYARATASSPPPTTGWQTGTTFSGLTAGTGYYIFARTQENTNYLAGPAQVSARITTAGAPGAVTGFTATAGSTQVVLSWSAPANDGGLPITAYQVSSDGGASWVTANSNTGHTFISLTNGTSYTFMVRANNTAGNGATSTRTVTPAVQPPISSPFIITGTTNSYSATLNSTPIGGADQPMQDVFNAIRSYARGANLTIHFDIGTNTVGSSISFANDAGSGAWGVITLTGEILSSGMSISSGLTVTSSANIRAGAASAITNSGNFTITGGEIRSGSSYAPVTNNASGILTISGGDVTSSGAWAISNQGVLNISGGLIASTASAGNPTINVSGNGSLVMTGGTVRNAATNNWGAIRHNHDGSVEITGGIVGAMNEDGVGINGVAIRSDRIGSITIGGTAIIRSANTSDDWGTIRLHHATGGTLTVNSGAMVENTGSGPAITTNGDNNGRVTAAPGTVEPRPLWLP